MTLAPRQRPDDATPPAADPSGGLARRLWANSGMLLVFALLVAGCAIFVPHFASPMNVTGLALAVATVGIIACTMLLCLAAGDFDLSVGSVVAMSGVLAAVVTNHTHSVFLGMASGILAGGVVGLANGFVIAQLGINALITTLATMQIVRGLAYIVSNGRAVGIRDEAFFALGITRFIGVPTPVWIMLACFVTFGLLLNRTIFGRNVLAVGGNHEAARLAGVRVVPLKVVIFTLQGLIAGFAGVIVAARLTSGQPKTAEGLELQVISACVLGGVSLAGGVGTMGGTIIGVLILGIVNNAMSLLQVEPFWQYVASGGFLLAAVLVDRLKQRRSA